MAGREEKRTAPSAGLRWPSAREEAGQYDARFAGVKRVGLFRRVMTISRAEMAEQASEQAGKNCRSRDRLPACLFLGSRIEEKTASGLQSPMRERGVTE